MATVIFYEKPNCANNTRQKRLLTDAGHTVIAKNLLTETWQADQLRLFFADLPVREWFNYSAPAIKHCEIEPDNLNEQQALALMLENALLIRRPLIQIGEQRLAGFNFEKVTACLLGGLAMNAEQDLESCSRAATVQSCGHD
jgi:nitrogenase-associated protein